MGNPFNDATAAAADGISLCTRDQVKSRLNLTKDGENDRIDTIVAAILPTLSNRLHRELMPHGTATRVFEAEHGFVSLGSYDLRAADTVVLTLDGTETELVAGVDYALWPMDPLTGTTGYLKLRRGLSLACTHYDSFGFVPLTITGDWGIWASVTEVPEDVNAAALDTALSWLDRPSAEIAMLGGGDPRFTEPVAPQTWDIPASAWRKLAPYNRPGLVV